MGTHSILTLTPETRPNEDERVRDTHIHIATRDTTHESRDTHFDDTLRHYHTRKHEATYRIHKYRMTYRGSPAQLCDKGERNTKRGKRQTEHATQTSCQLPNAHKQHTITDTAHRTEHTVMYNNKHSIYPRFRQRCLHAHTTPLHATPCKRLAFEGRLHAARARPTA